jgi:hypothetical protein
MPDRTTSQKPDFAANWQRKTSAQTIDKYQNIFDNKNIVNLPNYATI